MNIKDKLSLMNQLDSRFSTIVQEHARNNASNPFFVYMAHQVIIINQVNFEQKL